MIAPSLNERFKPCSAAGLSTAFREACVNIGAFIQIFCCCNQQFCPRWEMQVKRLPNGVHADISKLELAENELSGSLRYHRTSPPKMEIEIKGGSLSLLPWEE